MATYKNVGSAPWTRPSGEVVRSGRTFVATEREHARISRRAYLRNRLLLVPDAEAPPTPPEQEQQKEETPEMKTAKVVAVVSQAMEWPLRMQPDLYLKLHKQGPHAALARSIMKEAKAKKE